ncbi:MAG: hypothetical protein ACXVJL_08640 [Candidatus Angelobacter sp.]
MLSPEEVKLGLAQLEFRDQLLVFLEGALGIRQGELGALRWLDCEFENMNFSVQHSYYRRRGWAPEEHKNGSIGKAIAEASKSETGLAGMEVAKSLQPAGRFRLPFGETEGKQTTRLGFGVEEKDSTGVQEDRHYGSGLAHISAHRGNHAGRDGRTPTNDPGLTCATRICT